MASVYTYTTAVPGNYLTGQQAVYYTVPTLSAFKISQFTVTNLDPAASHTVTVFLAPNSAIAGTAYQRALITLSPNQSASVYQCMEQILQAGGTIQMVSDSGSLVSAMVSGILAQ